MSIQDPGQRPDPWNIAGDFARRIRALEAIDPCGCIVNSEPLIEVFDSDGIWRPPPGGGFVLARVICVGAGGGGGGGTPNGTGFSAGGGGGGGSVTVTDISFDTLPGVVPVTIGVGGVGGAPSSNGGDGGNSSFGSFAFGYGGGGGGMGQNSTFSRGGGGASQSTAASLNIAGAPASAAGVAAVGGQGATPLASAGVGTASEWGGASGASGFTVGVAKVNIEGGGAIYGGRGGGAGGARSGDGGDGGGNIYGSGGGATGGVTGSPPSNGASGAVLFDPFTGYGGGGGGGAGSGSGSNGGDGGFGGIGSGGGGGGSGDSPGAGGLGGDGGTGLVTVILYSVFLTQGGPLTEDLDAEGFSIIGLPQADGWIDDTANGWAYASATTFRVGGDRTAVFEKGVRLKLTQTTVKYFVVVGSAHSAGVTTVTVTGGSDYTLANAAITGNYYSRMVSPQGYPGMFNYAPVWGGFSVSPTPAMAKFAVVGRICTVRISLSTQGTSNATTFTVTVPIAAVAGTGGGATQQSVQGVDNGVTLATPAMISFTQASVTATVATTWAGGAWTALGNKAMTGIFSYEI